MILQVIGTDHSMFEFFLNRNKVIFFPIYVDHTRIVFKQVTSENNSYKYFRVLNVNFQSIEFTLYISNYYCKEKKRQPLTYLSIGNIVL